MKAQKALVWWFVVFAAAMALVLAGCGAAATPTVQTEAETPEVPVPTEEGAPEATATPGEDGLRPVDFDGIPAPERCDPAQPQLIRVAQFERIPVDNPYLDVGVGEAVVIPNDLEQEFQLSVFGQDLAAIDAFLDEVQVCFEALLGGPPSGFDQGSVRPPDVILLETIIEETGLSREELRARREELIRERGIPDEDGQGISLREILETLDPPVDPQSVLDKATQTALDEIAAAEVGGVLAPEQANGLRTLIEQQGFYPQLLEDPDAALLAEAIDQESDYGDALLKDKENLIIDIEWRNAPPKGEGQNFVVFFVIDPRLYQGQTKFYNWKSVTYAITYIYVTDGKVCDTLYRWNGFTSNLGQRCALAGAWTPSLSGYSSPAKWYSAQTQGLYYNGGRGNYYRIYGTWRED